MLVKLEEKKLLNSLKRIKYENYFRYKFILENENQKDERILTSKVNIYNICLILAKVLRIIDTPGFGDTRDLDCIIIYMNKDTLQKKNVIQFQQFVFFQNKLKLD